MSKKTHHAGCDRAHEGDNMDYWSEKTACGLSTDSDTLSIEDKERYVDCKRCLRILNRSSSATNNNTNKGE